MCICSFNTFDIHSMYSVNSKIEATVSFDICILLCFALFALCQMYQHEKPLYLCVHIHKGRL